MFLICSSHSFANNRHEHLLDRSQSHGEKRKFLIEWCGLQRIKYGAEMMSGRAALGVERELGRGGVGGGKSREEGE